MAVFMPQRYGVVVPAVRVRTFLHLIPYDASLSPQSSVNVADSAPECQRTTQEYNVRQIAQRMDIARRFEIKKAGCTVLSSGTASGRVLRCEVVCAEFESGV